MRTRAALCVLGLVLVCCACSAQLSDTDAERIAAEARSLLADRPSSGQLDSARLPPAIAALRPKLVYVKPDGLYIQRSTWFTRERGRAGLYRYRIAG